VQEIEAVKEEVSVKLGRLGVPGMVGAPFGMDPNQATFNCVLATIRASNGDPPASPEAAQIAEPVLTHKADPLESLMAAAPAAARQQLGEMIKMIGADPVLRLACIIQAAFALTASTHPGPAARRNDPPADSIPVRQPTASYLQIKSMSRHRGVAIPGDRVRHDRHWGHSELRHVAG
jgi:hypothetical protein